MHLTAAGDPLNLFSSPACARYSPSAPMARTVKQRRPPVDVDAFLANLQLDPNERDLSSIAARLCQELGFPDLSHGRGRKGLREAFKDYTTVAAKLMPMFDVKDDRVKGAGCVIVGKLSADTSLRNLLVKSGVLVPIARLLEIEACMGVALRTLTIMSSLGGEAERTELAKATAAKVVYLANTLGEKDERFGYCISVLSHSCLVKPALSTWGIDLKSIMLVMVKASKSRDDSISSHGFSAVTRLLCDEKSGDVDPAVIRCLVGHLRHPDIWRRAEAWLALHSITSAHSQLDNQSVDPTRHRAGLQSMTDDDEATDLMLEYGVNRCDGYSGIAAQNEWTDALGKVMQNGDFVSFGRKAYAINEKSEMGIADGVCKFEDTHPLTGNKILVTAQGGQRSIHAPFDTFLGSLPIAAKALRALDPNSREAAVLEAKYYMKNSQWPKAHVVAEKQLEADPDCVYAYYVLALGNMDFIAALRWSKKGLAAGAINCEYAGICNSKSKNEVLAAYCRSAYNDSIRFIKMAPPDSKSLRAVTYKHLLLELIERGSAVKPNLSDLRERVKKLIILERLAERLYGRWVRYGAKLVWQLVERDYSAAAKEWDPVFAQAIPMVADPTTDDDGLEELMQTLCCGARPDPEAETHQLPSHLNEDAVKLSVPLDSS
ncbi:hypothetical protein RQP46_000180 [Phenoliferia psychrophenolica]